MKTNPSILKCVALVVGLSMLAACHPQLPEAWTEESHGKDAEANYALVFSPDEVKSFSLEIDPTDWQAMLDDMTELYGEFGAGGQQTQPGPSAEMIAACVGLSAGDACDAPTPIGTRPGTCLQSELVFCTPIDMITACQNLDPGDKCTLPGPDAPSGNCAAAGAVVFCEIPMPAGGPGGLAGIDRDPIWVPCQVRFQAQSWEQVGIRFKGNSTLRMAWQGGSYKLPFKFDFDQFEELYPSIEDQRFYGFKRLAFANNAHDSSYLRDKVAGDLFREAGVPAPRRAFYRVFFDVGAGPIYFGLYTMAEVPDRPMFLTQFGADGGNLYKPDFGAANWQTGLVVDESSFPKKTNESEADWSDVENAIAALHADRGDPAAWRAGVEQRFAVDKFLRWLAINTVIQDWDTYGNGAHNYYLYGDPEDLGRLHWIPWDHNESLKPSGGMRPPLPLDMATVDERWPLIRFLIDDPVYQESYWARVQDFSETVFSAGPLRTRLQAEHDLIAPFVTGPEGEQSPYTMLPSPEAFEPALDELFDHIDGRHDAVRQALGL